MSMEDPTAAELLQAVNAAIYNLITGKVKTCTINGRTLTYNDLNELREMRRQLQMEVNPPGGGSIRLADISGT